MFQHRTPINRLLDAHLLTGSKAVEVSVTGNPVTFLTDLAKPLKSLLVPFLPVQSGSGDPSPQNIRPIVAWDGVKVWHGGKNLFNKDIEPYRTGMYISEVKNFMVGYTENANYNVYRIPVKPNTYYTFGLIKASTPMYAMLNEQGYVVNSGSNDGGTAGTYKTIITTSATKHLLLSVAVNGTYKCDDVLQLEEGQAHTEYEPITETSIPFAFPVYGGYVDMVTGEVWATYAQDIDDGSASDNWSGTASGQTLFRWVKNKGKFTYPPKDGSTSNLKVNYMVSNSSPSRWYAYIGSTGNFLCYTPVDTLGTKDDWLAYLAEHPLQIVYELATPVLLGTIPPEQITAIKGNNTIWSDANGNLEITYLKKG